MPRLTSLSSSSFNQTPSCKPSSGFDVKCSPAGDIQLERIARHSLWVFVLDNLTQGSATAHWKMKAQFRFSFDSLISWRAGLT